MVEAGADLKEAQKLARHANPQLTMNTYARARDSRLSDNAERVGDGIVSPESIAGASQKNTAVATNCGGSGYMVEAGGIEPETIDNQELTISEHTRPHPGQVESVGGQPQEFATDAEQADRSPAGQTESGSGHFCAPTEPPLVQHDLQKVVRAWHLLPEAVRRGIVAMVETVCSGTGARRGNKPDPSVGRSVRPFQPEAPLPQSAPVPESGSMHRHVDHSASADQPG